MRKRGRAPHYSLSLAIFLENLAFPTFQRIYKIKVHLLPSGCGVIVVIPLRVMFFFSLSPVLEVILARKTKTLILFAQ